MEPSRRGINHDNPPFSRVFVVCSKTMKEEEIQEAFSAYGTVDDVWMVKDRMTKENKGICYVKFDKASSAAAAIESLDNKIIGSDPKPIKVMIASSKNNTIKADYNDESARTRLFVVCPKDFTENDLKAKFERYGDFDYCNIIKDKVTGENKGFGYVKFTRASTAAVAMETCDKSFKAVLAEPKSAKFARDAAAAAVRETQQKLRDSYPFSASPTHGGSSDLFQPYGFGYGSLNMEPKMEPGINNRLYVIVSPSVGEDQVTRLFDIIPGLEYCDLKCNHSTGESRGFAYVTYNSINAAMYAKDKLNGFEYPPGCKLIVKYAEDPPNVRYGPPSPTFENYQYHSPPHSPMRSPVRSVSPVRPLGLTRQRRNSLGSEYDGRVFFVCTPSPPSDQVLRSVFGRFGVLTDIWIIRGKNYGYAKFMTRMAAESAITALHGMEVFGVKLKVMLADPPPDEGSRNKRLKTTSIPMNIPPAFMPPPPSQLT
jgi:RNA recognition motif-containing protein